LSLNLSKLYWIAGLLEGEGTFGIWKHNSPTIAITSTDRDVLYRVAAILGCNVRGPYNQTGLGSKDVYVCSLKGGSAIEWMMTLFPLMSYRRKEAIKEVILKWRLVPIDRKGAKTNFSKRYQAYLRVGYDAMNKLESSSG